MELQPEQMFGIVAFILSVGFMFYAAIWALANWK